MPDVGKSREEGKEKENGKNGKKGRVKAKGKGKRKGERKKQEQIMVGSKGGLLGLFGGNFYLHFYFYFRPNLSPQNGHTFPSNGHNALRKGRAGTNFSQCGCGRIGGAERGGKIRRRDEVSGIEHEKGWNEGKGGAP